MIEQVSCCFDTNSESSVKTTKKDIIKSNLIFNGKEMEMEVYAWDELISNQIKIHKTFYESHLLFYLLDTYPQQRCIIDIGANIGNHTTFFAEFMNAEKIHAFEPHPMNFQLLVKNTTKYPEVERYKIALGCRQGKGNITTQLRNMGDVCVTEDENGDVEILTLDAFNFSDVSMIKIDAEGSENKILEGSMETLSKCKPILMIEWRSIDVIYIGMQVLSQLGYVITAVLHDWNFILQCP